MNNVKRVEYFLKLKKGYLKKGNKYIADKLKVSLNDVKEAKNNLKGVTSNRILWKDDYGVLNKSVLKNNFNKDNVIFIPDLHAPFIKNGVLEWCKEQQIKYDCGTVIFAGDLIDGHAWSYHEHDVDGMSVGDELEAARKQLKPWFNSFPQAISLMGNHDLLIQRKAKTIGLSKQFIKGFGEVIGAPKDWQFMLEYTKDNVLYKHGSIGDAFKVAKESRISTCQGHFHAKTFVQWSVSEKDAIFGLQVGWGADRKRYAFDYGTSFTNKPIISLGIILDKGLTPIVKLMPL
jgi:hypothetical protein